MLAEQGSERRAYQRFSVTAATIGSLPEEDKGWSLRVKRVRTFCLEDPNGSPDFKPRSFALALNFILFKQTTGRPGFFAYFLS